MDHTILDFSSAEGQAQKILFLLLRGRQNMWIVALILVSMLYVACTCIFLPLQIWIPAVQSSFTDVHASMWQWTNLEYKIVMMEDAFI